MRHPFEILEPSRFRQLYWFFLVSTLALAVVLQVIGNQFAQKTGPTGDSYNILDFEFAHTPGRAGQIMETWGPDGVRAAKIQTWVDFLFLIAYSNAIALGVLSVMSARGGSGFLASLGRGLAYGQWLAAICDVIENIALLRILGGTAAPSWPAVAYYCAIIKFALVGAGLLYVLVMLPYASRKTSPSTVIGMES